MTHLTQMKPRWPGATRRTGAPWPWLSGSPPTWVASRRLGRVGAVEAPAVAGVGDHAHVAAGRVAEQAVQAGAAPALRRVEAAGAVERGGERVAGVELGAVSRRSPNAQRVVRRAACGASATHEVAGNALPSKEATS